MKEAMLSRLRAELDISADRHAQLRDAVERGVDSPWLVGGGGGGARGGRAAPPPTHGAIDALVGHRVKRYWPEVCCAGGRKGGNVVAGARPHTHAPPPLAPPPPPVPSLPARRLV